MKVAEQIIKRYENADVYNQKGSMRIEFDEHRDIATIYVGSLPIAMIRDIEIQNGTYMSMMLITAQDFKEPRLWKSYKQKLAKAANDAGILVLFTRAIDFGFGEPQVGMMQYDVDPIYDKLIEIAKCSNDDVKTAAAVFNDKGELIVMSYNQFLERDVWSSPIHAEKAIELFLDSDWNTSTGPYIDWQMILEPCYECLKGMIDRGARRIIFAARHKDKWNTVDYMNLRNDILVGDIRDKNEYHIRFYKWYNEKVNKFMEV